jgi:hypothetical protein
MLARSVQHSDARHVVISDGVCKLEGVSVERHGEDSESGGMSGTGEDG